MLRSAEPGVSRQIKTSVDRRASYATGVRDQRDRRLLRYHLDTSCVLCTVLGDPEKRTRSAMKYTTREEVLAEHDRLLQPTVRRVHEVHPETGEVSDVTAVVANEGDRFIVSRMKNRVVDEPFTMLTARGASALAGLDLSGASYAVLFEMLGKAEFGNQVTFNAAKFARRTGRSRSTVIQAVKNLVAHDVVRLAAAEPGCSRRYMLNPTYSYRGSKRKERRDAIKDWAEAG